MPNSNPYLGPYANPTKDPLWGPYDSISSAEMTLNSLHGFIIAKTVGIRQSDGSIVEYWVQPVDGMNRLVQKNTGGSDPDAYHKPSDGIPLDDLKQDVQTLLGKVENAAHVSGETTDQAKLASVGKVQELIGEGRRVEPVTSTPATLDQSVIYLVHDSSSDITFGTETVPAGSTAHVYYDGSGWIAVCPTAESVSYSGATSGLTSGNVQDAIDTISKKTENIDIIRENLVIDVFDQITPDYDLDHLAIDGNYKIISTASDYYGIYCISPKIAPWKLKVSLQGVGSSYRVRGVFLADGIGDVIAGAHVSFISEPLAVSTNENLPAIVDIPAGKMACVNYVNYNASHVLCYEKTSEVFNIQTDDSPHVGSSLPISSRAVSNLSMSMSDLIEDISLKTGVNLYEPITFDGELEGLRINPDNNKITEAAESLKRSLKIKYVSAKESDWVLHETFSIQSSSYFIGQVFTVESIADIAIGNAVNVIAQGTKTPIDRVVSIPAGKICGVSFFDYNKNHVTVEMVAGRRSIADTIPSMVAPVITSEYLSENPLAIIRDTPGYTSIFTKIGVIGGSMSSGAHPRTSVIGDFDGNLYEYSFIQFMARIAGTTAFNFSHGGMSAKSWPTNAHDDYTATENKCQAYIIQLGNNDVAEFKAGGYTLGNISDLSPISGSTVNDFVYNTSTYFGNIARIVNEIRKIQPRAYIFLSTFYREYGTIPSAFDYNQALRDIVSYYRETPPSGDELHYYLIDLYRYGRPYSYYQSRGSHPVATGYLHTAWEYMSYIDWIVKTYIEEFNDVAFVGTSAYCITRSPEKLSFTADGGSKTITLQALRPNATYSVDTDDNWLTASVDDNVVTVVAAANDSGSSRTGNITVTNTPGGSVEVGITQS